jgi:hypothetical protein
MYIEPYFQYVSQWTPVKLSYYAYLVTIMNWAATTDSTYGYHMVTTTAITDDFSRTSILSVMAIEVRFESVDDAVLFRLQMSDICL